MKIKILKKYTEANVLFSTPIGNGIAACGNKKLKEGMICDVELDIRSGLKYAVNAQKAEPGHYYIRNDGNFNYLQGRVESIDEDGCICFRLAPDCIIMVYSEDDKIKEGDCLLLKISKDDLEITLVGI